MKKLKHLGLLLVALIVASCNNDDSLNPVTDPVLDNIRYDLGELNDSGVSGDAVFNEQEDGSVQLIVEVEGTSAGNMHPAHIHMNSAFEGGPIIVSLEPVDGATGLSITEFSSDIDGNPISFEDIEGLDAYINVHLSAQDLATVVAQGDIGQNDFTGDSKTYDLGEKDVEGISGTVLFEERVNGFALATISLENTLEGEEHPAHIHMNSAIIGGPIIFSFNSVNGTSGMSITDTSQSAIEGEDAISYAEILEADAYVNVHLGPGDDLATIVAQGDIGSNELTGESITYTLNEVDVMGINGEITFEERINGFALATIALEGTPADGIHPAHIHAGEIVDNGPIIFSFNPVDGATGMSMSDTRQGNGDDEDSFTYGDILEIAGYVNVHLSATELGTIVAQGDIGSNLE
jgi:hypothetical protein